MARHIREGNTIVGRIGFESMGTTELWDDQLNDFTERDRPLGLTSPFAIDLQTLRVAFQLRGADIKPTSFTGALQALLNEASSTEEWRVEREITVVPFREWASTVDRIVLIRLVLERPNPNYRGRRQVEQIIEGANAGLAQLQLRAKKDDPQGIDTKDQLVNEAIDHAAEHGRYSAVGERGPSELAWTSAQQGAAEIRRASVDPSTGDVSSQRLRHELGDSTVEQEVLDDARAALEADEAPEEILDELEEDLGDVA